jgi:RNA polymerase I-specific transcription initiation factor RRN3
VNFILYCHLDAHKDVSSGSDWRSLSYLPSGTSSSRPTRRMIYSRIHSLLRSLLSLIPTLPTQLAPLVLRHYPHKREGIKEHVVYIRNIFEMCEYAEELRPGILECVLGRAVEIDVEIQIELDELEEAEAGLEETMSDIAGEEMREVENETQLDFIDKPIDEDSDSDDDEDDEDWQEDIQSDDEVDQQEEKNGKSEQARTAQIRLLVNKLDAIMDTMFQQLDATDGRFLRVCKGLPVLDSALTPARAISLRNNQFTDLMNIFTKMLLPTFKSRHVQFVLFWFASLDQDFGDLFLGLLLSKAIYSTPREEEDRIASEEVPMIMRVASASYVASLVSRAKYINKRDARTVMLNLCAFLEAHLDAYGSGWLASSSHMQRMDDSTVVGPHSLFYAVCQACFYIFCFRWRDLQLKDDEEQDDAETGEELDADEVLGAQSGMQRSRWCDGLEAVKRAIMSNLNPLANCSPAVAEQFAGVAQLTGFLYCWSLIEKNSRNAGGSPAKTANSNGSHKRADTITSNTTDPTASPIKEPGQKQAIQANTVATRKELDSFFPFDPYRLRASTKWVEPLYREWSDVAPEGMLDDDDDDEDDDEEEEEEEESSDSSSSISNQNRNGLKIPKVKRPAGRDRFTPSSASTNEDQIAQSLNSLEAMSISPFRSR